MKRLTPCGSDLRTISWAIFCAFVLSCAMATGAFAQHAAGHVGGAGHVSTPAASHPGVSRPFTPVRPPLASPATRSFLIRPPYGGALPSRGFIFGYPFPPNPFRPRRPIYPIGFFPPHGFGLYGIPFFGLGFGWGLGENSWLGCDPFFNWRYGCSGLPIYEYGTGYDFFSVGPNNPQPQMEIRNWPVYYYGEANSQFVQLYLKDGTVYNATDYWLVNGELHFKTVEENYTKVVEHEIDFGLLDLQMTIDVNTARGFRFVLRNEPLEQYLRDYPSTGSPTDAPAEPRPAGP